MADIDPKIVEIERFLTGAKLPDQVQLYPGIKVTNTARFVESHLEVLKAYGCKGLWDVFYTRLARLKELIEQKIA